jgi:hypothetical protein
MNRLDAGMPLIYVTVLVLFFLLFESPTHAQIQAPKTPTTVGFAAELEPRHWTKLTTATVIVGMFDIETTQAVRRSVSGDEVSYENNLLARPFAFHRERAYPVMLLGYAALGAATNHMRRSAGWERHVWWVPQTFAISIHVFCGVHNLRASEGP